MMNYAFITVIVVVIGVICQYWIEARWPWRVTRGRPILSAEEMRRVWAAHISDAEGLEIVRELASELGLEGAAGLLRPDDRLEAFNSPTVGDDARFEAVVNRVQHAGGDFDRDALTTLGEIVKFLAAKRRQE